jgi:HlyD family secretion protein
VRTSLSLVSPAWAQGAPAERPAGARPAGERRGARPADGAAPGAVRGGGEGDAGARGRDAITPQGANGAGERAPGGYKPGTVYVLEAGKPKAVPVTTGITDGTMTELRSQDLEEGDLVVVGTEAAANAQNRNLQPPPGMGGPQFRGPGGRR